MRKVEKLFYIGKFGETVELSDNGVMVKDAEMFSTGVHRGVEYNESDLNELVQNFSEGDGVPIQVDHSESAKDTVGYIKSVSQKDGKLMGKLHIIDEHAQDRINKGLMKKLSVSFYLKHTEEGFKPHKLREVSLVAFPQVKSARLFSENGYISDYEEQGGKEDMDKIDFNELKAELRKELEKEVHEQYAELQKKAELADTLSTQLKEGAVKTKVEKFQADKKVIPAQAEALEKLLASFSDEQTKLFDDFMKEQKVADFSEQGEVENHDEQDKRTQEQKDFDAFYEDYTKKFGKSL